MKLTSLTTVAGAALFASATLSFAEQTFKTDPGHTEVRFGWSHAGVSFQTAEFDKTSGTLVLDRDNIEASKVTVTVDTTSVSTGVEIFDEHIQAPAYFDTAAYPEMTFTSTEIKLTGETTAKITGDLTIKGVTQPLELDAELTFEGDHPVAALFESYKGDWVAFSLRGEIADHMSFGVGQFPTGPISLFIDTEMQIVE